MGMDKSIKQRDLERQRFVFSFLFDDWSDHVYIKFYIEFNSRFYIAFN
jgi:hypothetical protein